MQSFICRRCSKSEPERFQSCPKCKMIVRSSTRDGDLTILETGVFAGKQAGITFDDLAKYRGPTECLDYHDGPLSFFFRAASGERFVAFNTSENLDENESAQTFLIQSAPEGVETEDLLEGRVPLRGWMLRKGGALEATIDSKTSTCKVYWIETTCITKDQAPWDDALCL